MNKLWRKKVSKTNETIETICANQPKQTFIIIHLSQYDNEIKSLKQ